jgi:hypothetical protein
MQHPNKMLATIYLGTDETFRIKYLQHASEMLAAYATCATSRRSTFATSI